MDAICERFLGSVRRECLSLPVLGGLHSALYTLLRKKTKYLLKFAVCFGSQVIVQITVRHPEVVQGAMLIGPTIDPQARTLRKELSRWLAVMSRRPYAFPPLVYDYLKAGFKRAWRTLE